MKEAKKSSLGRNEAPTITIATVPSHLLGTEQCSGVGTTGKAKLLTYMPWFRTAKIIVHCNNCNIDLKTTVKY